jgi:hypothetical protein
MFTPSEMIGAASCSVQVDSVHGGGPAVARGLAASCAALVEPPEGAAQFSESTGCQSRYTCATAQSGHDRAFSLSAALRRPPGRRHDPADSRRLGTMRARLSAVPRLRVSGGVPLGTAATGNSGSLTGRGPRRGADAPGPPGPCRRADLPRPAAAAPQRRHLSHTSIHDLNGRPAAVCRGASDKRAAVLAGGAAPVHQSGVPDAGGPARTDVHRDISHVKIDLAAGRDSLGDGRGVVPVARRASTNRFGAGTCRASLC